MKHLTADDIIRFVSSDEESNDCVDLVVNVNAHIRECSGCLEKVKAFQLIYDKLSSMCLNENFEHYLKKMNAAKTEDEMYM